ncbi:hypothetical protein [Streptomyces sp. NBC_01460]|uniref:hypothetical protein n=1 Tax=Streptomyces sp. NBC_01460 TaxID=2903875 RepID=UPI003FCCB51D
MHLFDETRATVRYDCTAYPGLPDILKKPSKMDPDQIWEARPEFHHPGYSLRAPGDVRVTALDVNATYLSALQCRLSIGKLEHSTGSDHIEPKRFGAHLITPHRGSSTRTRTCPTRSAIVMNPASFGAPIARCACSSASPARSTA